jgi:undecaprenyl-diphosphatase
MVKECLFTPVSRLPSPDSYLHLSMLEELMKIDTDLFVSIHHVRNGFFDFVAPWLSNRWIWIPLYLWFAVVLVRNYKGKAWILIAGLILMIVASDQGANLFKNNVRRPRPCQNAELLKTQNIYTPEGCGGPYGYFSGHASNSFALALIMFLLVKRKNQDGWRPWLWLFFWAFAICWSRIYLGVHYPGDVFSGAVFGTIIAGITYILLTRLYLEKHNA